MNIELFARRLGCVALLGVSALATFHLAKDGPEGSKAMAQVPAHPVATGHRTAMPAAAPSNGTPAQAPPSAVPTPQQSLYQAESAVRKARLAGASENEVYRIRAAALPAQTIALLSEREQAESQWKEQAVSLQLVQEEH